MKANGQETMTLAVRPTFSESWYRVADLKVRLRAAAQISRQYYRGERWYVVRDPAGNQYHRISDAAYHFVALLDGRRTVQDAWDLVSQEFDDAAPTQPEVIQILSQMWAANLIEADVPPDATVLLRRHKQLIQREWKGKLMNLLFPRFPLWDPDRFLCRWMPVMERVISKLGAIIWLMVVIAAITAVSPHWADLKTFASHSTDPGNWLLLWAVFVGTKTIHELGHAFACRRFGGECHELGIMLLVLIPTPYVDASSAWSFPSRWQRIFVGAAGMIFELFLASIMAFIWIATKDSGSIVAMIAFNAMIVASVSTVIFNANPLLRYDGYYILADWLEIANFQQKSSEYALGLIRRHLFRVKQQMPLPPASQRAWMLPYAIASSIYRIFIGIMIVVMVTYTVPIIGVLMALGGVVTWGLLPVGKVLRYVLLDPELARKRLRASAITLAAIALIVALVGVIPFPVTFRATGVVEPVNRVYLYAQGEGFVESIGTHADGTPVKDGDVLAPGEVILVMNNPSLDLTIREGQQEIVRLEAQREIYRATNPNGLLQSENEMRLRQKQLDDALRRREELTLRAPANFSGRLTSPELRFMQGKWLKRGDSLGLVSTTEKLEIKTYVNQNDLRMKWILSDLHPEVRLAGDVSRVLVATGVDHPASSTNELANASMSIQAGGEIRTNPKDPKKSAGNVMEFRVYLDNPGEVAVPGQRAFVRFSAYKREPLIWQWTNRFMQMLQESKGQSDLM